MIRVRSQLGLGALGQAGDFFERLRRCAAGDADACQLDLSQDDPDVPLLIDLTDPDTGVSFGERLAACAGGDQSACFVTVRPPFATSAVNFLTEQRQITTDPIDVELPPRRAADTGSKVFGALTVAGIGVLAWSAVRALQ